MNIIGYEYKEIVQNYSKEEKRMWDDFNTTKRKAASALE